MYHIIYGLAWFLRADNYIPTNPYHFLLKMYQPISPAVNNQIIFSQGHFFRNRLQKSL